MMPEPKIKDGVAILEIYDYIGYDSVSGTGVSAKEFCALLNWCNAYPEVNKIEVWIHSLGGSIVDGQAMFAAIKSSPKQVDTMNVGTTASTASAILQAGKIRKMVPWGLVMIHNPSGGDSKELQFFKAALIDMMVPRMGMKEEQLSELMDNSTWMDADTALEMKMVDCIEEVTSDANLPVIDQKTTPQAVYEKARLIINSLTIKTEKMKNLAKALGLKDDASEEECLAAITTMAGKIKEMEDNATAALATAAKAKATDTVEAAVKSGKIKAEAKDTWIAMHIEAPETTAKLIETLPGMVAAPKIDGKTNYDIQGSLDMSIRNRLAEIKKSQEAKAAKK